MLADRRRLRDAQLSAERALLGAAAPELPTAWEVEDGLARLRELGVLPAADADHPSAEASSEP